MLAKDEWYYICSGFSYSEVILKFYELSMLPDKPNAKVIGDKTPYYIQHVDLLLKLFPDSCFVHIVIDLRDHALSARNIWGLSLKRSMEVWVRGIESLHRALTDMPERLIEARYEDVVANPESELDKVVRFFQLPSQERLSKLRMSSEAYGDELGVRK